MRLPVFALHTIVFPGTPLGLRVFEPRYLTLLEDVLPHGRFVVAAIRHGREVAGPAEPYRVGVAVAIESHDELGGGLHTLTVRGEERVALVSRVAEERPYPVWDAAPYPDEGGAGTDDVAATTEAFRAYLRATGEGELRPVLPTEPVAASWVLAAAAPGLLPTRQALLEVPGAGERLRLTRAAFRAEARLVRTLGAGLAADPGLGVSPN